MTATLGQKYAARREEQLVDQAAALEEYLRKMLHNLPRIDRVVARAKTTERFLLKAAKNRDDGSPKYSDPLNQIQDQIGARVVTFYVSDVERVRAEVERYFRPLESTTITPEREDQFGYFGQHYIMLLPTDVISSAYAQNPATKWFELQIKTLFQHAWAEAEHDLGYKPSVTICGEDRRLFAFASAQAWGADRAFDELFGRHGGANQN